MVIRIKLEKEQHMNSSELLADALGRINGTLHRTIEPLDPEALSFRPHEHSNSIAWLAWHLTRVHDDHVSEIAGRGQAWVEDGWAEKFGMDPDPHAQGTGDTPDDVAAIRADGDLLLGYADAVLARTNEYLENVTDEELDRIIDTSYDPPVSVGVRLVSVISDNTQHAGQAAYVRGLSEGRHWMGV